MVPRRIESVSKSRPSRMRVRTNRRSCSCRLSRTCDGDDDNKATSQFRLVVVVEDWSDLVLAEEERHQVGEGDVLGHVHEEVEEERLAGREAEVGQGAQELGHRVGRLVAGHDAGHLLRHALQQTATPRPNRQTKPTHSSHRTTTNHQEDDPT